MNKTTSSIPFTAYQKFAIFILAITQFTVILDFMVMSPLGDILMKSLDLKPSRFGFVVSAYAFSAGFSGLLTTGFADKFDRKKLLLFFMLKQLNDANFNVGAYTLVEERKKLYNLGKLKEITLEEIRKKALTKIKYKF